MHRNQRNGASFQYAAGDRSDAHVGSTGARRLPGGDPSGAQGGNTTAHGAQQSSLLATAVDDVISVNQLL